MKKVNGGCHCQAVQYKAQIDEAKVILCHCEDCQTMSGAPYRGAVVVAGQDFDLSGTVKNYIKKAASGNDRIQAFCPECGTHMYATAVDGDPADKVYNVRLGTVQQRNELSPTIEIWCDSAQAWLPEVAGTKKIAKQP